jgi:hypothetical protein
MLEYYLGSLAFGGVLIAASLIFGQGDLDADVDVDVDVDAEVELQTDIEPFELDDPADVIVSRWNPFFSMRFWTFALTSFGLSGSLLSFLDIPSVVTAVLASAMGLGLGLGAAWMFRALSRSQVSAKTNLNQIRGVHATVLLPVRTGATGKVRLQVDGQQIDLLARTKLSDSIELNSPVLVVNVVDGIANITPLPDDYREPSKE